jgi:hypothetical protein
MKIITNEERIGKGARLGKIMTFAGLGLLIAGLVVSLMMQDSPLLWLSFGFLLAGLLVSSIGTMNMNRWVREPRADQALAQGLKGFDDRYRLYNYELPAPHVLLGPLGLHVLTAMGQDGKISLEGSKFHRAFSPFRLLRFMAEEGLGKPFDEADSQVEVLREFLLENDIGDGVDIQNALVFFNPKVELSVSDPPRPVVLPKGLKKVIRKQQGKKMPQAQYAQILALFEGDGD